jgi:hypothetical protein
MSDWFVRLSCLRFRREYSNQSNSVTAAIPTSGPMTAPAIHACDDFEPGSDVDVPEGSAVDWVLDVSPVPVLAAVRAVAGCVGESAVLVNRDVAIQISPRVSRLRKVKLT